MELHAEELAEQLIGALGALGVQADLGNSGLTAAGIYVWGAERGDRPVTMVAILGKRGEYSWGEYYDHSCPLNTPVETVAQDIVDTLDAASGDA